MCWKCEAVITCLLAGLFVIFFSVGLLRYVFEVSTLDILLLSPMVLALAFEVAISIMRTF
ncbi:uncharacterized protein LOC110191989 isoform X2 [Drosophila serrata]|uniref:uncharacterized protein LOC110191989 isoform X2 n=1 Tax=Drosophila serrata TaxID=7274 RepID=UPI000A1CFF91|nr:uncharacterized protein LOC110191989 isoform X2 [Drosophila serrata]